MIDLRSDTVTRPTPAMLDAMMRAAVGDDVFGEDDAVNRLQRTAADRFGMEAALFCPSGTMTNQIGLKVHTEAGDEVICHELAHLYRSEGGGIAVHSRASVRPVTGDNGRFRAEHVRERVNARDDDHYPWTRVVTIENTVSRGGGACWDRAEIQRIRAVCLEHGLAFHLDGARLFNALVARGESPRDYGALFDTISICLSKGLGAPVGSLLLGSRALIEQAHRYRKVMGGGMRQAGYLAAAGSYALDHHVDRLALDHAKAKAVARELEAMTCVTEVLPAETNLVVFRLVDAATAGQLVRHLRQRDIMAVNAGNFIRFAFHLDVSDGGTNALIEGLRGFRAG